MNVAWSASADNVGVTGYDVLRDGNIVGSVSDRPSPSPTRPSRLDHLQLSGAGRRRRRQHSNPSTGVNVTTPAAPGPGTVSLVVSDDTYADQQAPTSSFGSATSVFADTSPQQRGFLKFAATGITGAVQSAVVRLFVTDSATNAPQLATTTSAWSQSTVTWNNQPAAGPVVADLGNVATNTFIDYPVTPVVTGNGTYSFELIPQSSNGLGVASQEATNAANRPQLRVTFLPGTSGQPGSERALRGHGDGRLLRPRQRGLVRVFGQHGRHRLRRHPQRRRHRLGHRLDPELLRRRGGTVHGVQLPDRGQGPGRQRQRPEHGECRHDTGADWADDRPVRRGRGHLHRPAGADDELRHRLRTSSPTRRRCSRAT